MRLDIKPMSVNKAWQGKRYKSDAYQIFEYQVSLLLKPMKIPEGPLQIYIKWGFSNAGSDWDNPVKPFQDCLQKKYGFNDNQIKQALVDVEKVKKGQEFIEWRIGKPIDFEAMQLEMEELKEQNTKLNRHIFGMREVNQILSTDLDKKEIEVNEKVKELNNLRSMKQLEITQIAFLEATKAQLDVVISDLNNLS